MINSETGELKGLENFDKFEDSPVFEILKIN